MEVKNIMQRKFLITSFLTAAIIILTSITSVVGVQTTKTENEETLLSVGKFRLD